MLIEWWLNVEFWVLTPTFSSKQFNQCILYTNVKPPLKWWNIRNPAMSVSSLLKPRPKIETSALERFRVRCRKIGASDFWGTNQFIFDTITQTSKLQCLPVSEPLPPLPWHSCSTHCVVLTSRITRNTVDMCHVESFSAKFSSWCLGQLLVSSRGAVKPTTAVRPP